MKSRTLVISDIHGCYRSFNHLLEQIAYHPSTDQLILLGDFVDKGPDSNKVVEQVIGLVRDDGAIAILGNHDQRFVDLILDRSEEAREKFFKHGGRQTLYSYIDKNSSKLSDEELLAELKETVLNQFPHHIAFLDQLPYYHEDEHYIYVHAGLNPRYANWKEQPKRDFLYIKQPFHQEDPVVTKTVIFGHTNTINLHGKPDVWFGNGKIGIDGGCSIGLQLNALEISNSNELKAHSVQAI
ncbi:MAG: metallophosphoesterase [Candidatus Pristimantibacillus sp.]